MPSTTSRRDLAAPGRLARVDLDGERRRARDRRVDFPAVDEAGGNDGLRHFNLDLEKPLLKLFGENRLERYHAIVSASSKEQA